MKYLLLTNLFFISILFNACGSESNSTQSITQNKASNNILNDNSNLQNFPKLQGVDSDPTSELSSK